MEISLSSNNQYCVMIDSMFAFPSCYTVYNEIKSLLEQGDKVVLDFSKCTHIDSSALGGLFSLRKCFSHDAELKIINANAHIMSVFSVYKLDKALTIET